MPPKHIHVFDEENIELQKQIGCMTGVLQIFDCHHLLRGRRLGGHNQKRLPLEHALKIDDNLGTEHSGCSPQIAQDKNLSKSPNKDQRMSTESSGTSFPSSSCSLSFFSIECNKPTRQEPPSTVTIFPEIPLMNSPNMRSSDKDIVKPRRHEFHSEPTKKALADQPGRQSLDFRDVVKDSIYKEVSSSPVKTSTKEETKSHISKHRDSPRPMPLAKSMDGSPLIGNDRKSKMHVDLNESLQVLVKLKEAPWNFSEASFSPIPSPCKSKDGSLYLVERETPRYSYDGREISRTSLDSTEKSRSGSKLRDLPRLSLDSRSCTFGLKPNSILNDMDCSSFKQKVPPAPKLEQELARHNRAVAKLMGLEVMPELSLVSQEARDTTKFNNTNKYSVDAVSSPKVAQNIKENQQSLSAKKLISNSRIPVEVAPWRQQDRGQATRKEGSNYSCLKQQNESVCCEIKKSLKDVGFQQSDKNLRDLKQILDAIQAKGLLETNNKLEHQQTESSSVQKENTNQIPTEVDQRLRVRSTHRNPILVKGSTATQRGFHSPIVIMRPSKSIKKSDISAASSVPLKLRIDDFPDKTKTSLDNRLMANGQIPEAGGTEHSSHHSSLPIAKNKSCSKSGDNKPQASGSKTSIQGSPRPQQKQKEKSSSPVISTSSVSPRLQQRKPQRQSANKPPSDSVSPINNKLRRKPAQLHQYTEQLNETSSLSQHGDEISIRSDSGISLGSQEDIEVTSAYSSVEKNDFLYKPSARSPRARATINEGSSVTREKFFYSSNKDVSTAEVASVAPDQPSPISVQDASFYRDDLPPSPARKHSYSCKDNKSQTSDNRCSTTDTEVTCLAKWSSEINQKTLKNIENLVQKLSQLSSTEVHIRGTDYTASLCETQDPDHRYVSEILVASGLVRKDLSPESPMPFQLHPSGLPINPDLFLVLEKTKCGRLPIPKDIYSNKPKPDLKKLHRKFVFDLVNEILVQKLNLTSTVLLTESYFCVRKLANKLPCGQRLLKEVCSEIDRLQADNLKGSCFEEDNLITHREVLHQIEGCEDFKKEVSVMVLEIERSIFKDLIDEVLNLNGEVALQNAGCL